MQSCSHAAPLAVVSSSIVRRCSLVTSSTTLTASRYNLTPARPPLPRLSATPARVRKVKVGTDPRKMVRVWEVGDKQDNATLDIEAE